MKKTFWAFGLTLIPTFTFAGGEEPQELFHKHIPSLYTYACAQLPPEEQVFAARPTLPPNIILPAYTFKKLLTKTSQPWQWLRETFNNANHYWYTVRKTPPNEFPGLECIIENEECSCSFIRHAKAPNHKAFAVASFWGLIDDAKKQLDAGTDIHAEDDVALILAAGQGHTSYVKFLLGEGANIHADKENALLQAIRSSQEETALFLLAQGADRKLGGDTENALHYAAQTGLTSLVQQLINDELETNRQEALNQAIIVAAEYGQKETIAALVELHADIHVDNDSPFRKACENGHTELAQFLLSCGAHMHASDDDAFTNAAANGHANTVQFLLDQGEIPDKAKDRALIATIDGSKDINDSTEYISTLQVLLSSGADIHMQKDRAIQNAIKYGDNTIITFLLANGASKQAAGEAELQREKRFSRDPDYF